MKTARHKTHVDDRQSKQIDKVLRRLTCIEKTLRALVEVRSHPEGHNPVLCAIKETEKRIMAKFDTVVELQQAINEATNATAANIQVLIDRINATPSDGLDGPQTEAVITHLTALRDQLKAMAATSTSPIPPPVTTPPTL